MRTVDEHLAEVLSVVQPLAPLELSLLDAHGCVLAEDVTATAPLPGFDNSSMDGYAVRAADVTSVHATYRSWAMWQPDPRPRCGCSPVCACAS